MTESRRRNELAAFAEKIRWLDSDQARASYEYAVKYTSNQHYGLNSAAVRSIERHRIDSVNVAIHWVRARVPRDGSVRIVFGEEDVFVAPTEFFLENWPNLFCPGRDDVLVFANDDDWVLFYCHDNELEYGRSPS